MYEIVFSNAKRVLSLLGRLQRRAEMSQAHAAQEWHPKERFRFLFGHFRLKKKKIVF